MKILFYYRCFESVGIEYLISSLESAGHETELIFEPGFDDTTYFRFAPAALLNRRKKLIRKASKFRPDLIAFSMPTNYFPHISEMARLLKKETGAPVIAGGPHPSSAPEVVLKDPSIDMVCLGEGEDALVEVVEALRSGVDPATVPGIFVKGPDGSVRGTPVRPPRMDLDSLPFPERRHFFRSGVFRESLLVMTGRGCPFNCSYCNNNFMKNVLYRKTGYPLRRRSPGNVIEEIERDISKYPISFIYFNDDDFTSSMNWLEEFLPYYAKKINIPFFCFANPLTINEKKAILLAESGCSQIFMGIDSGSPRIREIMNRPMKEERILKSASIIKNSGIRLHTTAIFGTPGETKEEMWATVKLMEKVKPDVLSTYLMYPYPGTAISDYARENGFLDEEKWKRVLTGDGSLHLGSIFNNRETKLAVRLTRLLPAYIVGPVFLRRLLKPLMVHGSGGRIDAFLYIALLPVTFPLFGLKELRTRFRLLIKSLT